MGWTDLCRCLSLPLNYKGRFNMMPHFSNHHLVKLTFFSVSYISASFKHTVRQTESECVKNHLNIRQTHTYIQMYIHVQTYTFQRPVARTWDKVTEFMFSGLLWSWEHGLIHIWDFSCDFKLLVGNLALYL